MEKFIALSPSTKKIIKVAKMASSLPVNVLITGQAGVGRKLLSAYILPNTQSFKANELEKLINSNLIDLEQYKSIIIFDIQKVINKKEFIQKLKDIKIDLSGNGITLKQSIYKSILLKSISKQEIIDTLYSYFTKELKDGRDYKKLLEIFEIPLLKASRDIFKSQLQMATKLKINRITLRKKLNKYFGE